MLTMAKIIGIIGFLMMLRGAFVLIASWYPRADFRDDPEAIKARFAMYKLYSSSAPEALDDIRTFARRNNVERPFL